MHVVDRDVKLDGDFVENLILALLIPDKNLGRIGEKHFSCNFFVRLPGFKPYCYRFKMIHPMT